MGNGWTQSLLIEEALKPCLVVRNQGNPSCWLGYLQRVMASLVLPNRVWGERRDDGRGGQFRDHKGGFPGQGSPIALWMCCPCDLLKCGKLDGIICAGEGLHSQLLLKKNKRKGRDNCGTEEPGRDVLEWGWGVEVGILEDGCGGVRTK